MEEALRPKDYLGIPEFVEILDALSSIAATQRPVRFVSRRGTGPHFLAEMIHRASARPKNKFVTVRCGLGPTSTLERELFGSGEAKGSSRRTTGKIQAADGGTLFIEQVQNASPEVQQVLLRILEDQEFTVGATTHSVDIRIIVSAPGNLETYVAESRFRADLFYRLNMMPIILPSELLSREAILEVITSLQRICVGKLAAQDGAGNAGRLEHAMRLALAQGGACSSPDELFFQTLRELGAHVARRQLESTVSRAASQCIANHASFGPKVYDMLLVEVQRALIRRAVEECNGIVAGAAAMLGLTQRELEMRMGDLGLSFFG